MNKTGIHIAILLIVTVAIFFINLGGPQLWDRDEPRNAGCAAEMMERANLVVPIFNGELRYQKPVLLYWLIISAYEVFGISEFAARFWSATLAIGSVLATYAIAGRLLGKTVAFLASIILATSLMFDVAARAVTPDSVLIFCNSIALLIYVVATFAPFKTRARLRYDDTWFPRSWLAAASMYGVMGLGVLAKGPVGFLIPSAIIGMFMLIGRLNRQGPDSHVPTNLQPARLFQSIRYAFALFHPVPFLKTVWAMRPLTLIAVVVIIAGPWYWMVDLQTEGDFTQLFFVGEHLGRATTTLENHRGGLWFYPLAILIGFFPWAVFWSPVAVGLKNQSKIGMEVSSIFLLCWVGVQVGIFSIAQTKLPSYVTPCYGALAILTADCLYRWSRKEANSASDFWMISALGGLVLAGVLTASGLGYVCAEFLDGDWWLSAIGLIPIACGLIGIWQIRKGLRQAVLITNGVASIILVILMFGFGANTISHKQNNRELLNTIAAADPDVQIATFRALESSWVVYGKRTMFELAAEPSRNEPSISSSSLVREKDWKPKAKLTPEQFVRACPAAMFVTTGESLDELKNRLPKDYQVIREANYFLREKKLYLLSRRASRVAVLPEATQH